MPSLDRSLNSYHVEDTKSQSCLSASFYPECSFFWSLSQPSLSARPVFVPGWSALNQILSFIRSISDGFNKLKPGS